MRVYPKGTKFLNYFLSTEAGKPVIRRIVMLPDGTKLQPRYPTKLYRHISTKSELEQLVNRLNHRENAKQKRNIQYRTSFIQPEILEGFRDYLKINIPNDKDFRYTYNTLFHSYFLGFFIGKLQLFDPQEWPRHQEKWATSLLSKSDDPELNIFDRPVSHKTIRHVIQVANRFMAYLKQKMPNDYPLVVFEPLSVGALKAHDAERRLKKSEPIGRYIPDSDWKKIDKKLPDDIAPFIRLMYLYGLRRAESLGFDSVSAVKNGYLTITKQVKSMNGGEPVYSPLKDREQRNTPHWFSTPLQTYHLIEDGLNQKMHPDTLSQKFDALMVALRMPYKTHDLRRTFITNALKTKPARDVQLAVGHASLTTTMGYAQDHRDMDNEVFDPSKTG